MKKLMIAMLMVSAMGQVSAMGSQFREIPQNIGYASQTGAYSEIESQLDAHDLADDFLFMNKKIAKIGAKNFVSHNPFGVMMNIVSQHIKKMEKQIISSPYHLTVNNLNLITYNMLSSLRSHLLDLQTLFAQAAGIQDR